MLVETKAELKNRLAFYRNLVTKAIKEKKLFRIYGYTHFPKLRAELIKRGKLFTMTNNWVLCKLH